MTIKPDDIDEIYDEIELEEDTGEVRIVYYILGDRPIKVTFVDDFPELVQTPDMDKKVFTFDHSYLKIINDSMDIKKVDETTFCNACLAIGVKPI